MSVHQLAESCLIEVENCHIFPRCRWMSGVSVSASVSVSVAATAASRAVIGAGVEIHTSNSGQDGLAIVVAEHNEFIHNGVNLVLVLGFVFV